MKHILDVEGEKTQLYPIFEKMREGNTILFLGAGASVGDRRYLSKEIIELYQSNIGKELGERNITTFVDILSADPTFSRDHFDSFVIDLLKKLTVTEAHKILAKIPWREIITTNYDLLIERAYDEVQGERQGLYTLRTVKNLKDLFYKQSNTEVKYIKLNGCMQDKRVYPLAFSTDDFRGLKTFYKNVLNELRNLSPDIAFLSLGYSYTDLFGKNLLEKFDEFNYRDKKWMINVDPEPNEHALPYYTSQKICIVKCSFNHFFNLYKEWADKQDEHIAKKRGLSVTDSKGQYIALPPKLLLNIEGIIRQLNLSNSTKERFIKDLEYYKGEEPNFNIIVRDVDVVKANKIASAIGKINSVLDSNTSSLIPLFFVAGDFGIGKSTFTLRLIYELERTVDFDIVAFEIIDFSRVKKDLIADLIINCKARHLILFCDDLEIESSFKKVLDLQRDLSIEQFQNCKVFILAPIRQNILERHKWGRSIPNSFNINMTSDFEEQEVDDLLSKLKSVGLVEYRDAHEKSLLSKKIKKEFNSDAFVSLMALITSGKHENDLIDSYHELTPETQKAFLFTALIHKHKLLMPASWLKQNISMTWEDFTAKVISAEGKGLLIQDIFKTKGADPDLYFRTKHPIIADRLVERILPNKDKQFKHYEQMLKSIEAGQSNSYLVNNLLKAFIKGNVYNESQLNKLFDAANTKLSDDPFFLLNYAINHQYRNTISDLKKAIDLLMYAESLLENRNHRFIHRRGVINFNLAKMYFDKDSTGHRSSIEMYLTEAKELFSTKLLIDPFSSYSYVDYIKLLVWELSNLELDQEDRLQRQIVIEELFDRANKTVSDGIERVNTIYTEYSTVLRNYNGTSDYKEHLDDVYKNLLLRPYACILLYNYYEKKQEWMNCEKVLDEIQNYQDNFEVIKFLYKFYGRNLHNPDYRIKLLRMSRTNASIETDNPLRYNYFNFVAETYNLHFNEGKRYLSNVKSKFKNLNPEFHFVWRNQDGTENLLEAKIIKHSGDKFKAAKILEFQQTLRLVNADYSSIPEGSAVIVRLHFYLYGLMAEITEVIN